MTRNNKLALGLGLAAGLIVVGLAGCGSDSSGGGAPAAGGGGGSGGSGGVGGVGGVGGGTGGTGGATGGTGGATGGPGGATGGTGGGTGGTGGTVNDDDCAHAIDYLTEADQTTGYYRGSINPTDEADFIKVDLTEGEFAILVANVVTPNGENPDDLTYADTLDTAITVFDATGATQLATMDDSYPRYSLDSELVWRVPATGTYCIKVQDWATWAGQARPDAPTGLYFDYDFGVLSPSVADGNNMDTEPNDSEAAPQAETLVESTTSAGNYLAWNFAMLGTQDDVDVYKVTVPAGIKNWSIGDLATPIGPGAPGQSGNGSTLSLGLIDVSDTQGNIIAQLDAARGSDQISLPLATEGDYLLWVHRKAGSTAGTNDFYNLVQTLATIDNTPETETTAGANDTAATAETLTMDVNPNDATLTEGYLLGFMNTATDVDFWQFDVTAGQSLTLACGAARSGSGLQGANFAILSNSTTVVQEDTETADADVIWSDTTAIPVSKPAITIDTSGSYFFRVKTTSQSPTVSSNFYRCAIRLTTPP